MRLKKLLFSPRAYNRVGQQQPRGGIQYSPLFPTDHNLTERGE